MNIDINKLNEIKEELETLDENDVIFIDDNKKTKYVVLPIDKYNEYEEIEALLGDKGHSGATVKIVSADNKTLTYEEYEKVRQQMIEVFDQAFKPKPDKLN